MSQVTVGENEGIESALRRFKRSVAKAGIFSDLRRIRHHETRGEVQAQTETALPQPPSLSPTLGRCQLNRKRVDSGPLF